MIQFTPLKDFHDEDLASSYCVGLSYTARARAPNPANPDDKGTPLEQTLLYRKVEGWLKDGKVRLGAPDNPQSDAIITGFGEVK